MFTHTSPYAFVWKLIWGLLQLKMFSFIALAPLPLRAITASVLPGPKFRTNACRANVSETILRARWSCSIKASCDALIIAKTQSSTYEVPSQHPRDSVAHGSKMFGVCRLSSVWRTPSAIKDSLHAWSTLVIANAKSHQLMMSRHPSLMNTCMDVRSPSSRTKYD